MLWSNVAKIREILGKGAILTRTGDIDGTPCFLIALPVSRWRLAGKTPLPNELVEVDPAPLAISEPDSGRVGNSGESALAILEPESGSVGNSEPGALAISEQEET